MSIMPSDEELAESRLERIRDLEKMVELYKDALSRVPALARATFIDGARWALDEERAQFPTPEEEARRLFPDTQK